MELLYIIGETVQIVNHIEHYSLKLVLFLASRKAPKDENLVKIKLVKLIIHIGYV